MEIIQQNGYRLIYQDNGSYRVDNVNGAEMPLTTFDVNLAKDCFVNWANKKAASDGNRKRHTSK